MIMTTIPFYFYFSSSFSFLFLFFPLLTDTNPSLFQDSREFGWETPEEVGHTWSKMVEGIQNHIGSLNWGYRVALREKKVDYLNAYATFVDEHTLKVCMKLKIFFA